MLSQLILCAGLVAGTPAVGDEPPAPEVLKTYREAASRAGRDPEAHIRLALWCEQHGLGAERLRHLARAILADPTNATARGLMGLVADGRRWSEPAEVEARAQADAERAAKLAEYNARRAKTPYQADAQMRLAKWCDANGLEPEAIAHYTVVTRLEPGRKAAWQRLGCKHYKGRWLTPEQIAAEEAEAKLQATANRTWSERLSAWRLALRDPESAAEARRDLASVTDPRAIPAIGQVFGGGDEADLMLAAQLLGQIDAPEASRGLVFLVAHGTPDVARVATETLARRDPRDYLDGLIALLRDPLRFQVRPVAGPGSPGVLFVEGEQYNVREIYEAPAPQMNPVTIPLRSSTRSGPYGLQETIREYDEISAVNNQIQATEAAVVAEAKLEGDVRALQAANRRIRENNVRVRAVLETVTGQSLGTDREAWTRWWTDQRGYAYQPTPKAPKPTFQVEAAVPFQPNFTPIFNANVSFPGHTACFAAGTPVRTLDGPRAIETLRVGDQVLTQDTRTGALSYQPIVAVYHNPPAATLRIDLGSETVVATGIHRFWEAGKGWTMARDLKPGSEVRTLGGLARVASVTPDAVQPVFNLEVADNASFLVGPSGCLVHDNSLVQPELSPFDAPPALAAAP